jgi:formylglycine-generating enzyme required for sulfatase activity
VSIRAGKIAFLAIALLVASAAVFGPGRADAQRRSRRAPPKTLRDRLNMHMVLIPAGQYVMGRNGGPKNQAPAHTVFLTDFYMDKFEITNAQYERFDAKHKRHEKSSGDHDPVTNVTWQQAMSYCQWRSRICRGKYSLPTEAQWERAARGPRKYLYAWGNEYDLRKANLRPAVMDPPDQPGPYWKTKTTRPGRYPANGYGLHDMTGNVWEMCLDWYDPAYYASSPRVNPGGPKEGKFRVMRGGSAGTDWHHTEKKDDRAATTYRGTVPVNAPECLTGFRCVRVP